MKVPYSKRIDHSHKKKYSLKTCAWLLFLLLQYFFASARRHSAQKKFVTDDCSTFFVLLKTK